MRVVRTDSEHLVVDGLWFRTADVRDAAHAIIVAAGSQNPAFDQPPFCYTGCPYGDAILALGCEQVEPVPEARAMIVPHDGRKPFAGREPIWPTVFGLDSALHWWADAKQAENFNA